MSFQDALKGAALQLEQRAKLELYKTDISLWAKEVMGIHLWSKQVEIANALINHKKVAVKSCHGSGKSFTASVIICWWVCTRIDLDAIVVSTAPTYQQVSKILWEYIRANQSKYSLPGRVTQEDDWKDDSGRVLGFGRKPADTNEHGFQGIHRRDGVLAVLDEACGIAETMWTGVTAITTGVNDRILAIANPDDVNTELGRIFLNEENDWYKITISAFSTPNFTDEYLPENAKQALVSEEWVRQAKIDWGEDSPRYRSKVLGEFSLDGSENTLFSQTTLATGQNTSLIPSTETTPVLGCDIARFGSDYSAVYSYHDGVCRLEGKWAKADTIESAEKIHDIAIRLGAKIVRVDGVGIGAGVFDQLARLGMDYYETVGMVGNAASPDLDKWANVRAFWYDTLREKMSQGKIDIDFEDKKLKEELEGIQYKFTNRGGIQIESKDDMKKRGIKSPDFADAAMYACADILIDPTDPASKLRPGDEYELALADILSEMELTISPY